jgi:hypothetical protein
VTPLRDGMNLVAKEYVAAQDPEDPGVLILSRFAGAAVDVRPSSQFVEPRLPTFVRRLPRGAEENQPTPPRRNRTQSRSGVRLFAGHGLSCRICMGRSIVCVSTGTMPRMGMAISPNQMASVLLYATSQGVVLLLRAKTLFGEAI